MNRLATFFTTDPDIWRGRAVRLLMLYFVLVTVLLVCRSLTHEVRPRLLDTRTQELQLTKERDTRDLRVQGLFAYPRIQVWAAQNGMVRFAETAKMGRDLGAQPVPPLPAPPTEPLKVSTKWN